MKQHMIPFRLEKDEYLRGLKEKLLKDINEVISKISEEFTDLLEAMLRFVANPLLGYYRVRSDQYSEDNKMKE